jgi:hypothetical protein
MGSYLDREILHLSVLKQSNKENILPQKKWNMWREDESMLSRTL